MTESLQVGAGMIREWSAKGGGITLRSILGSTLSNPNLTPQLLCILVKIFYPVPWISTLTTINSPGETFKKSQCPWMPGFWEKEGRAD